MAFLKRTTLFPFLVIFVFLFTSLSPAYCNDIEDKIFKEINDFRTSLCNLTAFSKNENSNCFADKVAENLKDEPCSRANDFLSEPGTVPKLPDYQKLLDKCSINIDTTRDAMMLPTCVPKLNESLLVEDYTRTNYSSFLINPNFTSIGVGSKDQWMVVVVTTGNKSGSFSNVSAATSLLGLLHCFVASLMGFIFFIALLIH